MDKRKESSKLNMEKARAAKLAKLIKRKEEVEIKEEPNFNSDDSGSDSEEIIVLTKRKPKEIKTKVVKEKQAKESKPKVVKEKQTKIVKAKLVKEVQTKAIVEEKPKETVLNSIINI